MRAVYLIIWAIITAVICYLLYEHNENANLVPLENVTSQTDEIQIIDATSGSAYVDNDIVENDDIDEKQDNTEGTAAVDTDNSADQSESNETDDSSSDEVNESNDLQNETESSEPDNIQESSIVPEQIDFLQKAFIEFGQNSLKLPKMENLEKFLDSISSVVVPSDLLIVLEGHADKSKSRKYDNFEVAQKRADFIKNALLSRGVPADRIQTISRGDTLPRTAGDSAEARKSNRRVELFIKQNNK